VSASDRPDRAPAAQFPRGTAADLASALGVHRNSVSRWSAEGAPAGPPYCELAWRTWAAANGKDCPTAPEQALLELLARAGLPAYRRMLEAQQARASGQAAPSAAPPVPLPEDPTLRKARADAEIREMELAQKRRQLVPIEDVHRLVDALATFAASVLDDAPRLVEALPLGPDDRQRVREAIAEQLAQRRAGLVAGLAERFQTWMEKP
jgi:hypothetical protein